MSTQHKTPPKMIAGFDPGLATGYSIWRDARPAEHGDVRGMAKFDDFLVDFVEKFGKPDVIVVEKFTLFRWKAVQQSGSDMPASKVIGKIELWARMHKIPIVYQPANILPIAVKWSQIPLPANHDKSHHISALNHVVYYLVKNKMMSPLGLHSASEKKSR